MRYPYTIASVGRQDFILAAHLKLFPCEQKDYEAGTSPLTLWNKYSGLKLNFANSKTKAGGDGNIELNKIDDVYLRTKAVMPMLITKPAKENPLLKPLGYVPNTYGSMQGKNPIQIAKALTFAQTSELANAMKSGSGKYAARNAANGEYLLCAAYLVEAERIGFLDKLDTSEHRQQFLAGLTNDPNYSWYQFVVGIAEQHPEYLDFEAGAESGEIVIYEANMKTPHTASVNAEGRTAVYSLSITADPKNEMPFCATLATGTGIPDVDRTGKVKAIGIRQGSYVKGETFTIRLTSAEWLNIISSAVRIRDAYTSCEISKAFEWARYYDNLERQNRNAQASANAASVANTNVNQAYQPVYQQ